MLINVYTIYDKKSDLFQAPFYGISHPSMIRSLQMRVNRSKDIPENLYPEDYTVYQIGTFDDLKGLLVGFDSAELVIEMMKVIERGSNGETND